MKPLIGFALILLAIAPPRAADSGSLFLDAGLRTSFWDRNHRLSMGGGMGLAYGATDAAEVELRLDYTFIPPATGEGPRTAVELGTGELAAWFAPYRGDFRPMVGAHLGMVRVYGEAWQWSLGMDAKVLYDIQDRFQLYGALTPSVLLGEGPGEVWLRAGIGVRARLGR